jgi:hypothetical protein
LDVALLCLQFLIVHSGLKSGSQGGSSCPTGLVAGESLVGVVDGDRVAIREPV